MDQDRIEIPQVDRWQLGGKNLLHSHIILAALRLVAGSTSFLISASSSAFA